MLNRNPIPMFARSNPAHRMTLAAALLLGTAGLAPAQQPVAQAAKPSTPGLQGPADAPAKAAPMPLSRSLGVAMPAQVPAIQVPVIDLTPILAEDAAAATGRLREGVAVPIPAFHPGMGAMLEVPAAAGGGWLWVADVHAPGAFGVRVHFDGFNLPKGASAIVYDPRVPQNLPSPYTGKGLLDSGEFWAWTSWSDTARVEVHFPPHVGDDRFAQFFTIDQAVRMYRSPDGDPTSPSRELSCHNDLECYSNWMQVGACVGRMSFMLNGSSWACSGGMLNNLSGDLTPYFMTARHCMEDNTGALGSLQVYWFFQRSGCAGSIPVMSSCPRTDAATYVRTNNGTDMSLVMLEGTVPRNLWWAGNNDSSFPQGTYVVGIHHPDGTRKRISFGNEYDYGVTCSASGLTNGFNVDYANGTVEPGSSGSPLFLGDGAFMGVSSCGPTGGQCPAPGYEAKYGSWFVGYGAFQSYMENAAWDDGYEYNDACGNATNLNIYSNGSLYSLIVKVNNPDWYRITVPAFGSCSFHISFTHANGDIDMSLRDGSCGGAVVGSSTSTTNGETINWTNPTSSPREVYLNVYLYNDTRNIYYLDFSRYGAPSPTNNTCASAIQIYPGAPGSTVSGSNQGATNDGAAGCQPTSSVDVWYKFMMPCSRRVYLTTQFSAFDTVLSVHTGCPGTAANQVACNDDANLFAGWTWSRVDFVANAGQTYYVRLAGYNGEFGNYNLINTVDYASNDLCANTVDLGAGSYAFNNCTCETDGPPDDVCLAFGSNQIYKDFWIGYTPTCYGTLEVNTFGSSIDTRVAIYANADNSSCPAGPNSALVCNDDAGGTYQSQVVTQVVANQRYILRIGSYYQQDGGPGTFNILFTPDDPCIPLPPCPADFDQDGQITPADIAGFVSLWAQSLANGTLEGDFDGNGAVQPADIGAFVNGWFSTLNNGC